MLKPNRWGLLIFSVITVLFAGQLIASVSHAQENSITANDAAKHIGEVQTVCGMVASAKFLSQTKKLATFLNLDQPYPKFSRLSFGGRTGLSFPNHWKIITWGRKYVSKG